MVANPNPSARRRHRLMLGLASFVVVPPALLAMGSWWFTAPLEESSATPRPVASRPADREPPRDPAPDAVPAWPEDRLDGEEAKRVLLAIMEEVDRRIGRIAGYTAILRRQERLRGVLGPEQTLELKVRHDPFAVYLHFLSPPKQGREVIYAEGRFDGDLIAHNGDWTRRLIPRLKLDPYGPVAMADNRHPITEVGLAHLVGRLLHFRKLDLNDPDAVTILDRTTDDEGLPWYRSIHEHLVDTGSRPFAYVEILYCPDRLLPLQIRNHEWPEPGKESEGFLLAERYHYEQLDLDAEQSDLDFDPANPAYEFHRY